MKKKKTKKLFPNKKGLAIFDIIGNAIQTVTNILPKPILFLLFLFILVIGAWFLSLLFNVFGIYCNSANVPVQLHTNIINSLSLIGDIPDVDELGKDTRDPEAGSAPDSVSCALYVENGTFRNENGTKNAVSDRFVYKNSECITCNVKGRITEDTRNGFSSFFLDPFDPSVCLDQFIYPSTFESKTRFEKQACGSGGILARCQPPNGYYYDSRSNQYVCNDNQCEGKTVATEWDAKLVNAGATAYYTTTSSRNPSSENFIGVTCQDLRPRLAIYGADVFNYKMWILLTVLLIIFWLWNNI